MLTILRRLVLSACPAWLFDDKSMGRGRSWLGWSEVTKPGSSSSLIRSSIHSSSSPILSPHFPNMSFHYVSLTSTMVFSRGVAPHEPGGRYVPKLSGHQTWQWRLPVHMEVLKGPSTKWRLSIDSFDDLRAFSNIFSQSSGYGFVWKLGIFPIIAI